MRKNKEAPARSADASGLSGIRPSSGPSMYVWSSVNCYASGNGNVLRHMNGHASR